MKNSLLPVIAIAAIAIPVGAVALIKANKVDEPKAGASVVIDSGLAVGEFLPPFDPHHVSGPDKGTNTCPVCKYGALPAVQVWLNNDDPKNAEALAMHLDGQMVKNESADFKAFVVMLSKPEAAEALGAKVEKAGKSHVAITQLEPGSEAVKHYEVNTKPEAKNTVFVYKDRKLTAKFINFRADKESLAKLDAAIAQVVK